MQLNLTSNIIIFISGAILSAIASESLENIFKYEYILVLFTIIVVLSSIFYFSKINNRIDKLCNNVEATVQYVEELYPKNNKIPYKGLIFNKLIELIDSADKEILILGTTIQNDKRYMLSNHEMRKKYHQTLEKKIKRKLNKGFTYIRINQVPQEYINKTPKFYLGNTMYEHIVKITEEINKCEMDCKNDYEKVNASISFMNIPSQRLSSIWLIDQKYIVIEVTGIAKQANEKENKAEERPYLAGLIIITDNNGKISDQFKKLFNEMHSLALPLDLKLDS